MDQSVTGGFDWATWSAGIGERLLTAAIDAEVNYPNQIERLKIERLGATGYYTEGVKGSGAGLVMSPVVLIGAALVAVLLLVKD